MTGLFARLSARVGGLEDAPPGVLRSRPASRYEGAQSDWIAGEAPADGDEVADADTPAPSSRQRSRRAAGDVPPTLDAALGADAGNGVEPVPRATAPAPPVPTLRAPVAVEGVRVASAEVSPAPVTGEAPSVVVDVVEREVVLGPVVARRPRPSVALEPKERPATSAALPPPASPAVRPTATSTAHPAAASTAPAVRPAATRTPTTTPTPVRPTLPPPLAPRRGDPASAADAAPVVHVTIGRVEVVAARPQAAAPAAARRQAPAVSTLDAYLRRRAQEQA